MLAIVKKMDEALRKFVVDVIGSRHIFAAFIPSEKLRQQSRKTTFGHAK